MALCPVTPCLDWRVELVDGTGAALGTNANPVFTSGSTGGGGGFSASDASGWTAGVSMFVPGGGVFNDTATALATGTEGTLRMTPNRAQHVNLRSQSGAELGTVGNPLNVAQAGGGGAVSGVKTSNTAIPGATNLGVLPAVANAAAPTYTETFQVLLSTDLSGNLRTINTPSGTQTVSGSVSVSNFPATQPVSGTVAVTQSTSPWVVSGTVTSTPSGTQTVAGSKTTNNAAPGATNVGALVGLANAAAPTLTEGNLVALSTDLSGNLRVITTGTTTVSGSVSVSNFPATQPVSGTVTANAGTGTFTVGGTVTANAGTGNFITVGTKSNNAVAPGATNLGVLPAIANAAAQTWTEGNQVLLSTDLSGNLRTINTPSGTQTITGSVSVSNFPATQPVSGTVTANAGTGTFTVGGTVTSNAGTGNFSVVGTKSNNAVAPGATNLGVLPAIANVAFQAWTEGDQVLLSTDLGGSLRTITQGIQASGSAISTFPVLTGGSDGVNARYIMTDNTGRLQITGIKTNNNAAPGATNLGVLSAIANAVSPTWTEGDQVLLSVDLAGNQRTATLEPAVAFGVNPTTVAAGVTTPLYATRSGIPFTIGGHPNTITVRANYTTAQTNTVVVTNSAGTKLIVVGFLIDVDNGTSVNVQALIGLAQTTTPTTTGVFGSHPGIAPGSGIARGGGSGIIGVGADGDKIFFTGGVPTGGSVDVIVTYFTVPS